ncbi:hypothetical protein K450DRAFT_223165 [Umbelopsis ramanniana AG]|uniref:Phosphatidic acid phosphatase type 2/haloperoxidase domain-containing protein n=1 Tax=Umbelopsis ramanniana AG TaxID=1314678 RepID=A0AAD5EH38_UMBRA|nr:uncharacterized protein K450DRAFT_223165 [Umbelopsis ramanniana AG]KAI8583342.1 hypothetical protein K450DRAFT_223165 [Umbelopsis ramanniana AG]
MPFSRLSNPRSRRLFISYLKDWVLVVVMTAIFFAIDQLPPYRREFSLEDKTIMFPYAVHEHVPVWLLLVLCFIVPFVTISLYSLLVRKSVRDFHNGILGLCLGLSMTIMMTDIVKITVGRPRPDMLDRCQPAAGSVDPPLGLSNYTICTTDLNGYLMRDGFKSFPSGHSSFSFAGLGFLSLYLAGKMRLFDQRGHTYKGFIFAAPWTGALLVAISRTVDYRHHWQDVTVGAILGTGLAFFAYRQYYPPLWSDICDEPFAPRIDLDFAPPRHDFSNGAVYATMPDDSNNDLLNEGSPSHFSLGQGSGSNQHKHGVRATTNEASLV